MNFKKRIHFVKETLGAVLLAYAVAALYMFSGIPSE